MTATAQAPITIIKRKKIIAGGHHGGAWKVAYADFVTAMMAFFLLMWLLGSTSESQRKGIADYFNPTVPISAVSGGGSGSFSGDSVFTEENLAQSGSGASSTYHSDSDKSRGDIGMAEDGKSEAEAEAAREQLNEIADMLTGKSGESMVSEELARHIVTRVTDEGLIVELFDLPGAVLFEGDSDLPTPLLHELTRIVSNVFALTQNQIAIAGHVRSQPVVRVEPAVWDISSKRARKAHAMILSKDLADQRIQRVTGYADRKQVVANPMSVRNNRIEMTLLR